MSKPEISRMLTLSTVHVTEKTMDALEREADENNLCLAVYAKSGFGYIIYLPDEETLKSNGIRWPDIGQPGATPPANWPTDLRDVLLYARDLDCDILCLDSDGPVVPYLKTYDDTEDAVMFADTQAEPCYQPKAGEKAFLKAQVDSDFLNMPVSAANLPYRVVRAIADAFGGYTCTPMEKIIHLGGVPGACRLPAIRTATGLSDDDARILGKFLEANHVVVQGADKL